MNSNAIAARQMVLSYFDEGAGRSDLQQAAVSIAAKKYVAEKDADKSGALDADEASISKEAFEKLDKDEDGRVTSQEIVKSVAGQEDTVYSALANGNAMLQRFKAYSSFLKVI